MSKHVTIEALRWAFQRLSKSCDAIFVDFLILKRDGLVPDASVTITTKSTATSARRLMGVIRGDGTPIDVDHSFFNPLAAIPCWRKEGYPRSGTYSTLDRSKTFAEVVSVRNAAPGLEISLTPDYLTAAAENFRRSKNQPVNVPLAAIAIWAHRYDDLNDTVSLNELVASFRREYNLSEAEVTSLFDQMSELPADIFADGAAAREDVAELLIQLSPMGQQPAPTEEPETVIEDLPSDLIEFLRGGLLLPDSLLRQLVTLLRAGKHPRLGF